MIPFLSFYFVYKPSLSLSSTNFILQALHSLEMFVCRILFAVPLSGISPVTGLPTTTECRSVTTTYLHKCSFRTFPILQFLTTHDISEPRFAAVLKQRST